RSWPRMPSRPPSRIIRPSRAPTRRSRRNRRRPSTRKRTMAVTLTETAASRVKNFLDNRGKGVGLRLGVKTTGCSGMAYVLEFVDAIESDDQVFESHGVKVIVNPKSLVYLDGTELDYGKEGL